MVVVAAAISASFPPAAFFANMEGGLLSLPSPLGDVPVLLEEDVEEEKRKPPGRWVKGTAGKVFG